MTADQMQDYLRDHPECRMVNIPDGWSPIDTVPLSAQGLEFLLSDGTVYGGPNVCASNPAFLVERQAHIAWRRW
jgi:hypothetical protein